MEVITISGKLIGDCEKRNDKRGNPYIRFKVKCEKKFPNGETCSNYYRCYCYNTEYADLKDGDIVFLNGDLELTTRRDSNGNVWTNVDIFVRNICSTTAEE